MDEDPKRSATLFVVPGSHPSMAGRLMLEHKGIPYRRVDLIPALHKPILRALRFPGTTVPALRIDGRRIQSTLTISRVLDQLQPDPPLFPADQARRAEVEEAERWGEEVLQPVPRRLSWCALGLDRSRSGLRTFAEGARLHVPTGLAVRTAAPIIWAEVKINKASDAAVEADLAALPAMLDRVDAWLESGVLGGTPPTAADYQIATSIRLLLCFDDLRDMLTRRPSAAYARALVPDFPGRVPAVLPEPWLGEMRRSATG
jgi:glutathione S-transferase